MVGDAFDHRCARTPRTAPAPQWPKKETASFSASDLPADMMCSVAAGPNTLIGHRGVRHEAPNTTSADACKAPCRHLSCPARRRAIGCLQQEQSMSIGMHAPRPGEPRCSTGGSHSMRKAWGQPQQLSGTSRGTGNDNDTGAYCTQVHRSDSIQWLVHT